MALARRALMALIQMRPTPLRAQVGQLALRGVGWLRGAVPLQMPNALLVQMGLIQIQPMPQLACLGLLAL